MTRQIILIKKPIRPLFNLEDGLNPNIGSVLSASFSSILLINSEFEIVIFKIFSALMMCTKANFLYRVYPLGFNAYI